MNHGYNLAGAKDDITIIQKDTRDGIRCEDLSHLWGGNSSVNLDNNDTDLTLKYEQRGDFVLPKYDIL